MPPASQLLMIRPVNFAFNPQTAVNNAFQQAGENADVPAQARKEFDDFAALLAANGVDVIVIDDTPVPHTPDSLFPNNWISFHADGTVVLYPMFAQNRRAERKQHVLEILNQKFLVNQTIDLTSYEQQDRFLEGTGSMVLDRDARIAYACRSRRTDDMVMQDFCERLNYRQVLFDAIDSGGQPIYHTNVIMCVADKYVVICLDLVADPSQQEHLRTTIENSGKKIVPISGEQVSHFAGNMLQVTSRKGEHLLVMSSQAYKILTEEQVAELSSYNRIVHSPLFTIEANGGGSARCMMAELYLQPRNNNL